MTQSSNLRKHTGQNPLRQLFIESFYRSLFQALEGIEVNSVVDVGCGEGFTLQKLQQAEICTNLHGIDISQQAVELAKTLNPDATITAGSIYQLPYTDEAFDIVICTEVLEHLDKPNQALEELVRITKQYCVLSVPNEPYFMLGNLLSGKNVLRFGNNAEHTQHWTRTGFKQFISTRLTVLSIKNPFPYAWTLILAEK